MDTLVRGFVVYVFLLLVFRVAGRRTLGETTTFDFVLLLIISEAVQQALIDNDNSVTNALLLVTTLVGMNIVASLLKRHSPRMEKILDGVPVVVIEEGRVLEDRMVKERIDVDDVLAAAREAHGVSRLAEVRCAVVEQNGHITVVLRKGAG